MSVCLIIGDTLRRIWPQDECVCVQFLSKRAVLVQPALPHFSPRI